MKLMNPFQKKTPTEEELMTKKRKDDDNSDMLSSAFHPQNIEDQELLDNKHIMAEIRRWQQDRDPAYFKMFKKLAGIQIDEDKIYRIPWVTPLCNLNGAYQIVGFAESIDVNSMMSSYSEPRINLILRHGVGFPLVQFIKCNYKRFGIDKNAGTLSRIVAEVFNVIESTYLRGLNDGERRLDKEIIKVYENKTNEKEKDKKGLFGSKA